MNQDNPELKWLCIAVCLLSAALISFQLALMQIFSITQWYHFAYMVISVALLGFGAAASLISLLRNLFLKQANLLTCFLMFGCSVTMASSVWLSQSKIAVFDSYLLFVQSGQVGKLIFTYLIFFLPFFLGALAIGLVFVRYVDAIGRLYFANLMGSGTGGIITLILMWLVLPQRIPAVIALFPAIGGLFILPKKQKISAIVVAVVVLSLSVVLFIRPVKLHLSQYKNLSYALNLPDAKITLTQNSPYGLLQVVSSKALRYAPGISLVYQQEFLPQKMAYNNADLFGPVLTPSAEASSFLDYTTSALAYALIKPDKVLVLNARTGAEASLAIAKGAQQVILVEPHTAVFSVLKKGYPEISALLHHPKVIVSNLEPRVYLAKENLTYDLVILPILDAFGGTSGLFALKEQYTLTKESFRKMWERLSPSGIISVSCWMDYPLRHPLKILATFMDLGAELKIKEPLRHIAAVRSWTTITFILKKSPLTPEEIQKIENFCRQMRFDPAISPELKPQQRMHYNLLADENFFKYIDIISSGQRKGFYQSYGFRIKPATDDQPYFSQFLRLSSLPHLKKLFGRQTLPFFELGYFIALTTLLQMTAASFLCIILPLFKIGWRGKQKTRTFLYFGGLGLGFMFVEMIFITRFILYFGQPVYAAAFSLCALLVCSGLGSHLSSCLKANAKTLLGVTALIALFIIIYLATLTPILNATLASGLILKVLFSFLFIGPLAVLMGIPFPLGLRFLKERDELQVPWAWGINGCTSVISTALATIIAVEFGFKTVMLAAAAAYGISSLAHFGSPEK